MTTATIINENTDGSDYAVSHQSPSGGKTEMVKPGVQRQYHMGRNDRLIIGTTAEGAPLGVTARKVRVVDGSPAGRGLDIGEHYPDKGSVDNGHIAPGGDDFYYMPPEKEITVQPRLKAPNIISAYLAPIADDEENFFFGVLNPLGGEREC
jgi:hypothetical protein